MHILRHLNSIVAECDGPSRTTDATLTRIIEWFLPFLFNDACFTNNFGSDKIWYMFKVLFSGDKNPIHWLVLSCLHVKGHESVWFSLNITIIWFDEAPLLFVVVVTTRNAPFLETNMSLGISPILLCLLNVLTRPLRWASLTKYTTWQLSHSLLLWQNPELRWCW